MSQVVMSMTLEYLKGASKFSMTVLSCVLLYK